VQRKAAVRGIGHGEQSCGTRVIQKLVLAELPRVVSRRGTSHALETNAYITGSINEDLLRRIEYAGSFLVAPD
jgi:hypothetical protein